MHNATRKMSGRSAATDANDSGVAGWLVMYALLAAIAVTGFAGANLIGDRFVANLPIVMNVPG